MFSPTLTWWVMRQFKSRKGLPQRLFFESFIVFEITAQNACISTLFTQDSYVKDTKWFLGTVMHIAVIVFLGLFRAEIVPVKALRFDLSLQAALHVSFMVLVQFLAHGNLRYTRFGDGTFRTYAKVVFWFWFVPVAVGTEIRAMYRKELRVTERLQLAKKLM